ncbi:MAG: cell division FtsZ family protein [Kiritimatiellae bacterium]|nr:cell division FtsZ family protein [Kiritimatiellia bacterium]MDW8458610.1 cell division protein FtsZ [Verrucomicrobiota bacterium]
MALRGNGMLFASADARDAGRILVAGVGGAGCNAVALMAERWTEGPGLIAINSDARALATCGAPRTLLIGEKATRGLGAAGDVVAGRLAAEESLALIKDALSGHDLLLMVGAMGRGTGTGAMPVIARAARDLGLLVYAFVALPFSIEGDRIRRVAEEGVLQLRRNGAAVATLPNDRLIALAGSEAPMEEAFARSDEILANGIHAIWHLLSRTGIINITFADIQELAERSGGTLAFGHADAQGPGCAAAVLQKLFTTPLLEGGRLIREAQGILVAIAGGPDLTLSTYQGIVGQIQSSMREDAHMTVGVFIEESRRNRISVTVLTAEAWRELRTDQATGPSDAAEPDRDLGPLQPELNLGDQRQLDRGPFGKTTPTMINGEDLDIPTFIRRGIKLSSG